MQELAVVEILAVLFLFIPLLGPFFKNAGALEGLCFLPVLALGITIGIFPAYGFRPECVPLLLYELAVVIVHIPVIVSILTHLKNDDFYERRIVYSLISLVLLAGTAGAAFYFLPLTDTALLTEGIRSTSLRDVSREEELFLRIYGPIEGDAPLPPGGKRRPLLLLVPPAAGSVTMTDRLCDTLRQGGFTVMTYSRRGLDLPAVTSEGKRIGLPWGKLYGLFQTFSRGMLMEKANARGRKLEEERARDIVFLLAQIRANRNLREFSLAGADPDCLFLAGYGEGGAALLLLAGSPGFAAQYPAVRGILAVESPVLSILHGEERKTVPPREDAGWFRSLWAGLSGWAANTGPKKITAMSAAPGPEVPLFLLLSDRVIDPQYRNTRYKTILGVFGNSRAQAVLTAVHGAGPLDYSDIPGKFPLMSALFPGKGKTARDFNQLNRMTAALMINFASPLLEAEPGIAIPRAVPPDTPLEGNIHKEAGGFNR
jgi:hypothetical protein